MPLVTAATAGFGLIILAVVTWMLHHNIQNGTLNANDAFGIRTKATKSSEKAWDAGHQAADPLLRVIPVFAVAAAVLSLLLAVFLRADGDDANSVVLLSSGLGYALVVALLLVAARKADRAAKQFTQ